MILSNFLNIEHFLIMDPWVKSGGQRNHQKSVSRGFPFIFRGPILGCSDV